MKPDLAKLALPIGLLGLNVAISLGFLLGGRLPDPAPAGFWIDGSVLSEAPPWMVAFRLPMIMAMLLVGIGAALKWDPRFAGHQRRRAGAWGPITNLFLALMCISNAIFLTAASAKVFVWHPLNLIVTGLCLFGAGNFVAKCSTNGFWGLHNRWTRTHESVERRTNRLLGILWMCEGIGVALAGPLLVTAATRSILNLDDYMLMSVMSIVILAFLPVGIAAFASYSFAKQAAAQSIGD